MRNQVIADMERDALHREIKRSQGSLESSYDYDPMGRLTRHKAALASGRSGLSIGREAAAGIERSYRYDLVGNLSSQVDSLRGKQDYRYDPTGRILATTGRLDEVFAFDPAGNLQNPQTGRTPGGSVLNANQQPLLSPRIFLSHPLNCFDLQSDYDQSMVENFMTNATSAKKLPSNSPAAITTEPESKLRSDTHSKMKNRIANRAFAGDTSKMIRDMRKGTPASVIPELANRFGMSQDGLFAILRLPRRIMKSRISKNKTLSPSEQDRMYRAHRVWSRAIEVLEDENSARSWINRVNRTLGGEAPLSLLDTVVGYELVLDTLGQIENGVIS